MSTDWRFLVCWSRDSLRSLFNFFIFWCCWISKQRRVFSGTVLLSPTGLGLQVKSVRLPHGREPCVTAGSRLSSRMLQMRIINSHQDSHVAFILGNKRSAGRMSNWTKLSPLSPRHKRRDSGCVTPPFFEYLFSHPSESFLPSRSWTHNNSD